MIDYPGPGSPADAQHALLTFLRGWYGDIGEGEAWASPDGCPALLSWWHSLVLANPKLVGSVNRFYVPERELVDPFVRYRGPTVEEQEPRKLWFFCAEDQGVFSWACESGDDPTVWARADWPPTHSDSWSPVTEKLSGFLIGVVLTEAMYGAAGGGAWTSMKQRDFEAISGLDRLELAPSPSPHQALEYWRGPGFIAVTSAGQWPGEVRVMFGAKSTEPLGDIGELVEDPYAARLWE